ncbi:MAG TPA: prepilin-type N-terminal cleavage/methylation domain-containing protein [Pirellulales bacterium]|nr:prepilin-type N-terminal cleavage/methylation domain-containing protein [Pirellulales bacterium]
MRRPSSHRVNASSPSRRARSGFTLIELLTVIVIIGMLAALVTVAASKAITTARNTQITTEIGLLDSALQTYKNDAAGAYPPDCTLLSTPANGTPQTQDYTNRQNRILAHLRKAFPRLIVSAGYGAASGPSAGTLQYMSQKAFSQSTLYGAAGSVSTVFGGTTPGGFTWGDFNNMDPAEALVFWVGGFAVPYVDQTGKWSFKMIGFAANKVGNASSSGPNASGPNAGFGPFNLDVTSRDVGPFEFQQARLGDADGDGWPEYYPPNSVVPQPPLSAYATANASPPYVYFDAVSYGSQTTVALDANNMPVYAASAVYPTSSGSGAQPAAFAATPGTTLAGQWGLALPYAATVVLNNTNPATVTWANPQKFQIICAGQDLQYWFDPSAMNPSATHVLFNNWLRTYPIGTNYSQADFDNLTNFTSSTLQSAQP